VTLGVGNFLGVIFTTWIITTFTKDGVKDWTWIFLIPCFLTVTCAVAFLLFFKEPPKEAETEVVAAS